MNSTQSLERGLRIIPSLRERTQAARTAYQSTLDKIEGVSDLNPEKALNLSIAFASYYSEINLCNQEAHDSAGQIDKLWSFSTQVRVGEVALYEAHQGDYSALKTLMNDMSYADWGKGERREKVRRNFAQIAQLLPEHGSPIKLLDPAWADARSNP